MDKLDLPYIVDLDDIVSENFHLDSWVEENHELMDELILVAAGELIADTEISGIDILEFWLDGDVAAILEMKREGLLEALENILLHWVSREEYEKAALTRDLISSLDK